MTGKSHAKHEHEQFDAIEREWLSLPVDDDGFVLPECRARAAALRAELREREISGARAAQAFAEAKAAYPNEPAASAAKKRSRFVSEEIEELVALIGEKKELTKRIAEVDDKIDDLLQAGDVDLGGGFKIVRAKQKRQKREKLAGAPEKKGGVMNAVLDCFDAGGDCYTRVDVFGKLDGYTPQQVSMALTRLVQNRQLVRTESEGGGYTYERPAVESEEEDAAA